MTTLSAQDNQKRAAALAALDELVSATVVGVGTGSTVDFFIDGLATQKHRFLGAVSSSERSSARLRSHGIAVLSLDQLFAQRLTMPVYVDGADEINAKLHMIKGGGGALTREKIVAAAAERFVCIADSTKQVAVLGRFALPIEVIEMALAPITQRCERLGGTVRQRAGFVTDNGHPILDVSGLSIDDPVALEDEINAWPGVVTVGLFARRPATVALIATQTGVRRVLPQNS